MLTQALEGLFGLSHVLQRTSSVLVALRSTSLHLRSYIPFLLLSSDAKVAVWGVGERWGHFNYLYEVDLLESFKKSQTICVPHLNPKHIKDQAIRLTSPTTRTCILQLPHHLPLPIPSSFLMTGWVAICQNICPNSLLVSLSLLAREANRGGGRERRRTSLQLSFLLWGDSAF